MDVYQKEYRILASDVGPNRLLRPSRLFTFLQEAAIAHTEALGFGREKTLDRGLLWVVTLQEARITRLPEYDAHIVLSSVPGEMMHAFYPRYYQLSLSSGEPLLTASALWMLMEAKTRTMVFPEKSGVAIPAGNAAWETFLPTPPALPAGDAIRPFQAPYSSLDINGHMNNASFLDLAVDLSPEALLHRPLRGIRAEYSGEVKADEAISLKYAAAEKEMRLAGFGEKRLFRIAMLYA